MLHVSENKNNNAHYSRASILKARINRMLVGACVRIKSRLVLLLVIHGMCGGEDVRRSERTYDRRCRVWRFVLLFIGYKRRNAAGKCGDESGIHGSMSNAFHTEGFYRWSLWS